MSKFKKTILPHDDFYISMLTKDANNPYLLFIHGGPGFNCGVLEYLIEHDNLYSSLNYNVILYDQRGCGRSKRSSIPVTHRQNITDLNFLFSFLKHGENINLCGLIGHSYGAKLLFDFYGAFQICIPGIFLSTADSVLTPRLNNLMLDLAYLKKNNADAYQEAFSELNELAEMAPEKIWKLTEKLAPVFQQNKDRVYFYWSNLSFLKKTQEIQNMINLPISQDVFTSVRQELYSTEKNYSVAIHSLLIPYLWINGFHDYIMNGAVNALDKKIRLFFQSAHYPHIEEEKKFCDSVNKFMTTLKFGITNEGTFII